ncbi:DUF2332 family protein [Tessaracoccus massiliensis]|uniref:DUF2332 family protein n=1 Tax=Tessaracoccus massiliensis TaxID=1522311 RepID=UPI00058FDBD2|nr:DUF2332 family protein [Tessaracoccus massiliensis]
MKGSRFPETEPIDRLYEWFADETAATSPVWERLCRWIARTPEVHRRLDGLPGQARQPNRFLAAVRFLDGPTRPGEAFAEWVDDNWAELEGVILTRTTQTNEPGRCAVVAPVPASSPASTRRLWTSLPRPPRSSSPSTANPSAGPRPTAARSPGPDLREQLDGVVARIRDEQLDRVTARHAGKNAHGGP